MLFSSAQETVLTCNRIVISAPPVDQASVAPSLLVRRRASTCAFLPRGVLHVPKNKEQAAKPAACCFATSQPRSPGSSSRRPLHIVARSCARRRQRSQGSGGGR